MRNLLSKTETREPAPLQVRPRSSTNLRWLEERGGPHGCLMNMVDDASGDTRARLGSEETIWAAAGVLRAWVKKYGIPVALYTDWKNVNVREASAKEQFQGVVPVTQSGQMCRRLGIRIIAANSPQAKGRVERNPLRQ